MLFGPVFVCPVRLLCCRAIEISVHNIELTPMYKQLQVLTIFFMKSKFGNFYRLEFCTEFFSYSSQTSSWCPMVADPTIVKYMVGAD